MPSPVITNNMISGSLVGPGAPVRANIVGDVFSGDFVIATAFVVSGSDTIELLQATMNITQTFAGVSGEFNFVWGANQNWPGHLITTIEGVWEPYTIPVSCSVKLDYYHGFAAISTNTTVGFVWEPRLNPFLLLSEMYDRVTGSGSIGLSQVLDAVRRVHTSPGQV